MTMDEQKEETPTKSEDTEKDTNEGDKPKSTQLIEDANLAAKRMEEATKALKEQNDRQEKIQAEKVLGGRADAGATPVKEEITDEQFANTLLEQEKNPLIK